MGEQACLRCLETLPGFWLPGGLAGVLEGGRGAGQDAVELAA